ncbi:MAG: 16S rRNA (guanine(527)-N(7))-methyltransferase RsmG [Alphaproteobacteria bacterium]|nr:MAG: 16S rRNA (guanine(527)-N(7))-methyltransferase RsmG [Alphaproteobacteria bacterium]
MFLHDTGVSRETLERLRTYADMLGAWQSRMNLVSARTLPDLWHRHMLDSAQILALAEDDRAARGRPLVWLDIGSGAGFPGLVTAIITGETVHLVEKSAKKCRFLKAVAEAVALSARVHNVRIEALEGVLEAPVDVVTARACAPLPKLLELAYPWLSGGAVGLFLKGQYLDRELTEATKCWRLSSRSFQSRTSPEGRILRVEELDRV